MSAHLIARALASIPHRAHAQSKPKGFIVAPRLSIGRRFAGSSVSVQEYLVRPREEQTAAAAGIAAMEDAAAVVSAIEARVPLASAEAGLASSYALPSAAYPVVCHAALACLTALVPDLLA